MRKKTCYLFVFDGFADYETSSVTTAICGSNIYQLKTIGISKEPVRSMSGMTIIPDCDFMPTVDLHDIDDGNTAMLILPFGSSEEISPFVEHCLSIGIPVMGAGWRQDIFEQLGIVEEFA